MIVVTNSKISCGVCNYWQYKHDVIFCNMQYDTEQAVLVCKLLLNQKLKQFNTW